MDLQNIIPKLEAEESTFDPSTLAFESQFVIESKLETDELCELMRMALTRESMVNTQLLANINILVSGYNTLDDSLFQSPLILFSDIEQLLDVKLTLDKEIKDFQTKTIYWYLSCLYSAHKVEYTYLDQTVKMPNLWRKFLMATNLLTISQIMSKAEPINTSCLVLVENAYPVIMELSANMSLASRILSALNIK